MRSAPPPFAEQAAHQTTVFVLNYGWMYAGMWQLAKRVLPNTALERILFPSKADLLQFFSPDNLLVGSSLLPLPPWPN